MNGTYFSKRLRIARETAGKTQAELAKHLDTLGTTVSNWEKGIREPNIETIQKIANFLHCDIDYLFACDKETKNLANRIFAEKKIKKDGFSVGSRMFAEDFYLLPESDVEKIIAIKPTIQNENVPTYNRYKGKDFDFVVIDNILNQSNIFLNFEIITHGEIENIGNCHFSGSVNDKGIWGFTNFMTAQQLNSELPIIAVNSIKGELKGLLVKENIKSIKVFEGFNLTMEIRADELSKKEKSLAIAFMDGQAPKDYDKSLLVVK
jgi:transcriptional regulator with XRE-family HTH domain